MATSRWRDKVDLLISVLARDVKRGGGRPRSQVEGPARAAASQREALNPPVSFACMIFINDVSSGAVVKTALQVPGAARDA